MPSGPDDQGRSQQSANTATKSGRRQTIVPLQPYFNGAPWRRGTPRFIMAHDDDVGTYIMADNKIFFAQKYLMLCEMCAFRESGRAEQAGVRPTLFVHGAMMRPQMALATEALLTDVAAEWPLARMHEYVTTKIDGRDESTSAQFALVTLRLLLGHFCFFYKKKKSNLRVDCWSRRSWSAREDGRG